MWLIKAKLGQKTTVISLIPLLFLSGCLLNDGSELLPTDVNAISQGIVITVSGGLLPTYTWSQNGVPFPVAAITVVQADDPGCQNFDPNQQTCTPVWGLQTSGLAVNNISPPRTHGTTEQGLTMLGTGNQLVNGTRYRVMVFRNSQEGLTSGFTEFVASTATLYQPSASLSLASLGGAGVVAQASGGAHSVALKNDGTVWTWGNNSYGQLGLGTTLSSATPQQVPGLANIVAVAAGEAHTLALTATGQIWAFGDNGYGQLGDGTAQTRLSPLMIDTLDNITSLSAGRYHSLARRSDGTLWAWGANDQGQLGTSIIGNAYTPTLIVIP